MTATPVVDISCNGRHFTDIQAIFLDKDGTLADVASYLSQLGLTQAQLMEHQQPGTYEFTLRALGISGETLKASGLLAVGSRRETIIGIATVAAMAGCPWIQALEMATATLNTADQQCSPKAAFTPLLPGALDFLKRLRDAGLKIIMVSADSQDSVNHFVEYHRLNPYFDKLQGVSCQNPSKMAPDFLQTACQHLDICCSQGLVIGDAASDLHMAQSAKGFIGFVGGWHPPIAETDILIDALEPQTLPAYAFVTSFDQILLY